MEASLTIVLPVHNAEATLRHDVLCLLEVAEQLTDRLELLIFDDGSTDQTIEVACELAMLFPQVGVLRHGVRRGLGSLIETGLAHTMGEIVMVHDGMGSIDVEGIQRLWRLRHGQAQVAHGSRPPQPASTRGLDRLAGGSSEHRPHQFSNEKSSSFHMLQRHAMATIADDERQKIKPEEVPMTQHSTASDHAHGPRRPSYLGLLKEFALGE